MNISGRTLTTKSLNKIPSRRSAVQNELSIIPSESIVYNEGSEVVYDNLMKLKDNVRPNTAPSIPSKQRRDDYDAPKENPYKALSINTTANEVDKLSTSKVPDKKLSEALRPNSKGKSAIMPSKLRSQNPTVSIPSHKNIQKLERSESLSMDKKNSLLLSSASILHKFSGAINNDVKQDTHNILSTKLNPDVNLDVTAKDSAENSYDSRLQGESVFRGQSLTFSVEVSVGKKLYTEADRKWETPPLDTPYEGFIPSGEVLMQPDPFPYSISHYEDETSTDEKKIYIEHEEEVSRPLPDPTPAIVHSQIRRFVFENLSERDKASLRLGRLIMSTVLSEPDVRTADSISRFFIDNWLAKMDSSSALTDSLNVDLLSKFEKTKRDAEVRDQLNNRDDEMNGIYGSLSGERTICAVAFESLDRLIEECGPKIPILQEIREALLPAIYMPDVAISKRESLSSVRDITDKEKASTTASTSPYLSRRMWCTDSESMVERICEMDQELKVVQETNLRLQKETSSIPDYTKEVGCLEASLVVEKEKILDITREKSFYHDKLVEQKRFNAELLAEYTSTKNSNRALERGNELLTQEVAILKEKVEQLEVELLEYQCEAVQIQSNSLREEAFAYPEKARVCKQSAADGDGHSESLRRLGFGVNLRVQLKEAKTEVDRLMGRVEQLHAAMQQQHQRLTEYEKIEEAGRQKIAEKSELIESLSAKLNALLHEHHKPMNYISFLQEFNNELVLEVEELRKIKFSKEETIVDLQGRIKKKMLEMEVLLESTRKAYTKQIQEMSISYEHESNENLLRIQALKSNLETTEKLSTQFRLTAETLDIKNKTLQKKNTDIGSKLGYLEPLCKLQKDRLGMVEEDMHYVSSLRVMRGLARGLLASCIELRDSSMALSDRLSASIGGKGILQKSGQCVATFDAFHSQMQTEHPCILAMLGKVDTKDDKSDEDAILPTLAAKAKKKTPKPPLQRKMSMKRNPSSPKLAQKSPLLILLSQAALSDSTSRSDSSQQNLDVTMPLVTPGKRLQLPLMPEVDNHSVIDAQLRAEAFETACMQYEDNWAHLIARNLSKPNVHEELRETFVVASSYHSNSKQNHDTDQQDEARLKRHESVSSGNSGRVSFPSEKDRRESVYVPEVVITQDKENKQALQLPALNVRLLVYSPDGENPLNPREGANHLLYVDLISEMTTEKTNLHKMSDLRFHALLNEAARGDVEPLMRALFMEEDDKWMHGWASSRQNSDDQETLSSFSLDEAKIKHKFESLNIANNELQKQLITLRAQLREADGVFDRLKRDLSSTVVLELDGKKQREKILHLINEIDAYGWIFDPALARRKLMHDNKRPHSASMHHNHKLHHHHHDDDNKRPYSAASTHHKHHHHHHKRSHSSSSHKHEGHHHHHKSDYHEPDRKDSFGKSRPSLSRRTSELVESSINESKGPQRRLGSKNQPHQPVMMALSSLPQGAVPGYHEEGNLEVHEKIEHTDEKDGKHKSDRPRTACLIPSTQVALVSMTIEEEESISIDDGNSRASKALVRSQLRAADNTHKARSDGLSSSSSKESQRSHSPSGSSCSSSSSSSSSQSSRTRSSSTFVTGSRSSSVAYDEEWASDLFHSDGTVNRKIDLSSYSKRLQPKIYATLLEGVRKEDEAYRSQVNERLGEVFITVSKLQDDIAGKEREIFELRRVCELKNIKVEFNDNVEDIKESDDSRGDPETGGTNLGDIKAVDVEQMRDAILEAIESLQSLCGQADGGHAPAVSEGVGKPHRPVGYLYTTGATAVQNNGHVRKVQLTASDPDNRLSSTLSHRLSSSPTTESNVHPITLWRKMEVNNRRQRALEILHKGGVEQNVKDVPVVSGEQLKLNDPRSRRDLQSDLGLGKADVPKEDISVPSDRLWKRKADELRVLCDELRHRVLFMNGGDPCQDRRTTSTLDNDLPLGIVTQLEHINEAINAHLRDARKLQWVMTELVSPDTVDQMRHTAEQFYTNIAATSVPVMSRNIGTTSDKTLETTEKRLESAIESVRGKNKVSRSMPTLLQEPNTAGKRRATNSTATLAAAGETPDSTMTKEKLIEDHVIQRVGISTTTVDTRDFKSAPIVPFFKRPTYPPQKVAATSRNSDVRPRSGK